MLRLDRAGVAAICGQAREEYPAECCGILSAAAGSDLSRAHRCTNIQDQLHARAPVEYPGRSGQAYYVDPGDQFRIFTQIERSGGRITGFYHSHVDGAAHFSDEDRRRAMLGDDPAFPDAAYLVVAIDGNGRCGHRAYRWQPATRTHAEIQVEVVS